jgi:hypothetical protein
LRIVPSPEQGTSHSTRSNLYGSACGSICTCSQHALWAGSKSATGPCGIALQLKHKVFMAKPC